MTKSWINYVFITLGIHVGVFVLILILKPTPLLLSFVFLSLATNLLILSLKMNARMTSPYALATMFVDGLKKQKFGPPISKVEEPDAVRLMSALNELAVDLKEKHETIKKLENLRIEFVANVSHELKTPLTSIQGYTETLLEGAFKDEQTCQKFLKRIEENSEKLRNLISDLLDLSRLEAFPDEINWQKISTASISEKLESVFFPILNSSRKKMFIQFMDPEIQGDRKKLEQVFYNLLDNAIRYTADGTLIQLKQSKEGRADVYIVSDNGPGISKEHLPRIFERFYRVDSARNSESGGTGLGLAIVKHIVIAHGGQITVESSPGQGTKFIIRIPHRDL